MDTALSCGIGQPMAAIARRSADRVSGLPEIAERLVLDEGEQMFV